MAAKNTWAMLSPKLTKNPASPEYPVPVYFEMLDNKSGNSHAANHIKSFKTLISIVGG